MLSASFLAYRGQHPDFSLPQSQVVDDPNPAAFPAALRSPAKLSNSARTANQVAAFWVGRQRKLKCSMFVVRQIVVNQGREESALYERQHARIPVYVRDVYPSKTELAI